MESLHHRCLVSGDVWIPSFHTSPGLKDRAANKDSSLYPFSILAQTTYLFIFSNHPTVHQTNWQLVVTETNNQAQEKSLFKYCTDEGMMCRCFSVSQSETCTHTHTQLCTYTQKHTVFSQHSLDLLWIYSCLIFSLSLRCWHNAAQCVIYLVFNNTSRTLPNLLCSNIKSEYHWIFIPYFSRSVRKGFFLFFPSFTTVMFIEMKLSWLCNNNNKI